MRISGMGNLCRATFLYGFLIARYTHLHNGNGVCCVYFPSNLPCRPTSPFITVVRGDSVWTNRPELSRTCPVGLLTPSSQWIKVGGLFSWSHWTNKHCACIHLPYMRSEGVTVVVLSVSLSTTILQATRRLMSDTNSFSATRA